MTLRYPGHWAVARQWQQQGSLQGNAEADASLIEKLTSDPSLRYDPHVHRDRLILSVQGSALVGETAGFRRDVGFTVEVPADRVTLFSAMELTTSRGITIVAHYLARQRGTSAVPAGFATPERFVDTAWVIDELDRRVAAVR